MKDIMGMMGKVKEMQAKMEEMQAELEALEVEGTSGAGLVSVTLSGNWRLIHRLLFRTMRKCSKI